MRQHRQAALAGGSERMGVARALSAAATAADGSDARAARRTRPRGPREGGRQALNGLGLLPGRGRIDGD
jgi:hypothetical protein